ncbi:uncharacterized protein ACA1_026980 [Acanthamoeba castellanii str. Neff]|uniref:Uncharacterized protein n=1 Tax=Acanthamoeba castellanii (strain ATCC 30010 / Neff) TaxID=1257118 RepID=L8GJ78_ACACF|nr:uncharacterized protein ACA1_026980 [Acanthamoeba castellanii str. Neff]ELR12241.1 hypothetical protein ACA1_026980 [Acanthamoeba castellanii str. Neff]
MSQEQKQQKGDPILEGQEPGIQRGKKENVCLHTSFEGDNSLIEDTERMSRKLSGERDEVVRGDVREGVETRLHTTTAEPRFNVMSTTASGAADLPDTKLGGDVKHLGESVLHHKTKMVGKETPLEPSVLDPGFTGMTANKSSSNQ